MAIEIVKLTDKGWQLSHSTRSSNDIGWKTIYFLAKMGGASTKDKIAQNIYGGNYTITTAVIRNLITKNIVTGDS